LSCGEPPMLRVHGDLVRTEHPTLTPESVSELVNAIMNEPQRARFDREHEVDFACELPGKGRFRVNVFLHSRGPGAVLRTIPTQIPSLESLNMPPVLKDLCTRERGLILVTGPTGSGKSTTLAAMIDVFPAGQQAQIRTMLSESLEAVVAQTLLKKKGGGGRVAACEILIGVPAVRNLIREAKLHQIPSMMQTGQRVGMQTLDMALADLVKRGMIEPTALPARPTINGSGNGGAAHAAGSAPAA